MKLKLYNFNNGISPIVFFLLFFFALKGLSGQSFLYGYPHHHSYHHHNYHHHHHHCYGPTHLLILDSNYFARMDSIRKQKFNEELEYIDKAYVCLKEKKYGDAIFWARKVASFKEFVPDRYIVLTIAAAHTKERMFNIYYKNLKNHCSPEQIREVEKELISIGKIKKGSI